MAQIDLSVILEIALFERYVTHAGGLPSPAVSAALRSLAAALASDGAEWARAGYELQTLAAVFRSVSKELGLLHVKPTIP
jgi:hypothetical protein